MAGMSASQLDQTFVALADQTRRAIIERLLAGEARVTELAKPHAMSLNAVSKHIRVLENADLIIRRKAGREHFLSLKPSALDPVADWITAQRTFWTQRLDVLEQELNKAAIEDSKTIKAVTKGSDHE